MTKTTTFTVNSYFKARIDSAVIGLRREGYTAYTERDNGEYVIVTNASRPIVNMAGGNGLFTTYGHQVR